MGVTLRRKHWRHTSPDGVVLSGSTFTSIGARRAKRRAMIEHLFSKVSGSKTPTVWTRYRYMGRAFNWWVRGYTVCYAAHESGSAFCKRRRGHLGDHRTSTGATTWIRLLKWPHVPGNCYCGNFHDLHTS